MKLGDKVRIIGGPRHGQIGIVSLVAENGVFVEMPDGKHHSVRFEHAEKIKEEVTNES